jgi:hypothetical protein
MSSSDYIGFQCDYSPDGTLSVTFDSQIKDPKDQKKYKEEHPSAKAPYFKSKTVLVPRWLPIILNAAGEEETVGGRYFISCRTKTSVRSALTYLILRV